jgi:ABC-2 type transport system permease protein
MYRHFGQMKHDIWRLVSYVFWPLMDILLWGIFVSWMNSSACSAVSSVAMVICVAMWYVMLNAELTVGYLVLEEIWAQNLVNLLATPLTFVEWALSGLGMGISIAVLTSMYCFGPILIFGHASSFSTWFVVASAAIVVAISGCALGFFMCSLLITWGSRIQNLFYMVSWILGPISCVYYPATALPAWLQPITSVVPMVYAFESVRAVFKLQQVMLGQLLIGFGLACCYLIAMFALFRYLFYKSRVRGLSRLVE